MRAGLMTEVIRVEKRVDLSSEYGNNCSKRWETFISKTRAKVTYDNGDFVNQVNELVHTERVSFEVRIYHQITPDMRIIWKNRKYRILSLQADKKLQSLIIKTELINE